MGAPGEKLTVAPSEVAALYERLGSHSAVAAQLRCAKSTVHEYLKRAKTEGIAAKRKAPAPKPIDAAGVIEALRKAPLTLADMAQRFGTTVGKALDLIQDLRGQGYNIHEFDGRYSVEKTAPVGTTSRKDGALELTSDESDHFRFGFVTDNHIGSKYARNDVLDDLYDRFARSGVTKVYNAGNWIDGEAPFNRHDLLVRGMDAQIREMAKRYPKRDGITTYYVAGDDHEGWYAQREGVEIGRYAEMIFRDMGRTDLVYLGYVEADIQLVNRRSRKTSVMRVHHPGGGSAYAISYAPQKIVESYEGGDKPAVLLIGHYHKQEILNYRNVWIIQGGTTEDQTIFMRKKRIEAHIGGVLVDLEQDRETGAIVACNGIFRYFNRGYYEDRNGRWSHAAPVTHAKRTLGGV